MTKRSQSVVSFFKNNNAVVLFSLVWCVLFVLTKYYVIELYDWILSLGHFRIWQPFSYIFIPGSGLFSLINDILCLILVGRPLEQSIGSKKFYTVIFCSAIICSVIFLGYSYGEFLYECEQYPDKSPEYIKFCISGLCGAGVVSTASMIACAFIFPDLRLSITVPKVSIKLSHFVLLWMGIGLLSGKTINEDYGIFDGTGGIWSSILGSTLTSYVLIRYWKKSGRIYLRNKWF